MIKISGYWDSLSFRSFKTGMFEPLFSRYIPGQYASEYKPEMSRGLKRQSRYKNVEKQTCKIQIVPVLMGQHNVCIDKVLMFIIHPN